MGSGDQKRTFASEAEILQAYPIVLKFRIGRKDVERFEQLYIGGSEYNQLFQLLAPSHRSTIHFFESTMRALEEQGLVRAGDASIGRFAVIPVRGNRGDDLGENFLLLQQETGPLLWLGKLASLAAKEAFKLIMKAVMADWAKASRFEIDHAEVRARARPGRVNIPFRGIDIHTLHRPEGSLIEFLACLQQNYSTMTTLNPPPDPCIKALGDITKTWTD